MTNHHNAPTVQVIIDGEDRTHEVESIQFADHHGAPIVGLVETMSADEWSLRIQRAEKLWV